MHRLNTTTLGVVGEEAEKDVERRKRSPGDAFVERSMDGTSVGGSRMDGGGADKVGRTKDARGRGRFEMHGFAWRSRGRDVGMQGKGKPDLFGA